MKYLLCVTFISICITSINAGNIKDRIQNEGEANPGQFPFLASIQDNGGHRCGGTIVSETLVVTNGKCCRRGAWEITTVVGGRHSQSVPSSYEQKREIKLIDYSFTYNTNMSVGELCSYELSAPFKFNKFVNKVTLPSENDIIYEIADTPRFADFDIIPRPLCEDSYWGEVDNTLFCTESEKSSYCYGDAGGPMVQNGIFLSESFPTERNVLH
ncbi:CTRB [Lepeophtheirus salmonis]|uniref:CTRB n=1 Tax=Lepeophtheirus salmonis TaxID=72036 RepID=A0A7R8D128_LEPSM|nr:CTRB [Lepeophtheirus salmonis]CAF2966325.1 CTRB [Lepeophtheirus salmonis]